MLYFKKSLFFLLIFSFSLICQVKKQNVQYEIVREYNGRVFYQKETNFSGRINKIFKIDDKPVAKDYFYQEISEAKKQDWIKKEEKREADRLEDLTFSISNKIRARKKIFKLDFEICKKIIKKIEAYDLYQYCVFSPDSFASSSDYDQFVDVLVPELESLLLKDDSELDFSILDNISKKLESYKIRLKKFLKSSLENAISTCDDTKKLKKLIKLMEGSSDF